MCGRLGIRYKAGTECLITAHLELRAGVNVTGEDRLTPKLIRPGGAPPGR